jgi:dTDP-4-dehydrorhamnose reductase
MKILLTGAQGQLGLDFQKLFQKSGIPFLATDINELDIANLTAVRDIIKSYSPTTVINCAAYNAVDKAEEEFHLACMVNAIGPRNLAIATEEHGIPLVHFSTDYVFDGDQRVPYTIADMPNPINRYGQSKYLGERLVQSFSRRFYLVRLSWVFGIGNENFPKKILEWSKTKHQLKVVTDQVSCPAYTVDIASITMLLLRSGAYGLYHLTNQGFCSRFDWARFILKKSKSPIEVVPATENDFPTPAKRPKFSAIDSFPIKETLGILPSTWKDATERFLKELGV